MIIFIGEFSQVLNFGICGTHHRKTNVKNNISWKCNSYLITSDFPVPLKSANWNIMNVTSDFKRECIKQCGSITTMQNGIGKI